MSNYNLHNTNPDLDGIDMDEIIEDFLVDDLSRMGADALHEWCQGPEAQALVERGVLRKPTLMRLSREDDKKRRTKLMCYTLAKQNKDPHWDKLVKYHTLYKNEKQIIFKKFGNKASRLAAIAQKEYIKRVGKEKATPEEIKADNAK